VLGFTLQPTLSPEKKYLDTCWMDRLQVFNCLINTMKSSTAISRINAEPLSDVSETVCLHHQEMM
jgi:hypothetical protein